MSTPTTPSENGMSISNIMSLTMVDQHHITMVSTANLCRRRQDLPNASGIECTIRNSLIELKLGQRCVWIRGPPASVIFPIDSYTFANFFSFWGVYSPAFTQSAVRHTLSETMSTHSSGRTSSCSRKSCLVSGLLCRKSDVNFSSLIMVCFT